MRSLRGYFLAGLVVVAPLAITIWLAWWFISLFDRWVKPLIPDIYNPDNYLPFTVPGVGLVFTVAVITMIGAFTANLVGRSVVNWWERILDRMPVLRSVYRGTKQIFHTALSQGTRNFKSVALIEYPRPGVHVIAFIARELDSGEIGLPPGSPMYACFMPTTPNPTSGFLFFVHKDQVRILDVSVEDAAKLVISAGLVLPGQGAVDEHPLLPMLLEEKEKAREGETGERKAREKAGETAPRETAEESPIRREEGERE